MINGKPGTETAVTDLLEWAAGFTLPQSSDGQLRKSRLSAVTLPAPAECRTDRIRGQPGWRRPSGGAIAIDVANLAAGRDGFRRSCGWAGSC